MTGPESTRLEAIEKLRDDIREKASDFYIRQCKVKIRTIPSTKFPSGGRYQGYVFDVQGNKIVLNDTFAMQRFTIFISEIASPADIWEAEGENGYGS